MTGREEQSWERLLFIITQGTGSTLGITFLLKPFFSDPIFLGPNMAGSAELHAAIAATSKALEAMSQDVSARAPTEAALNSLKLAIAAAADPSNPTPSPPTPAAETTTTGGLLCELDEVSFLSPRGKFAVKVHTDALVFVGKTSTFTLPLSTITAQWELPESSERGAGGTLFACALRSPVVNGKQKVSCVAMQSKPNEKRTNPIRVQFQKDAEVVTLNGPNTHVLATGHISPPTTNPPNPPPPPLNL